jgi:hypothetical protein
MDLFCHSIHKNNSHSCRFLGCHEATTPPASGGAIPRRMRAKARFLQLLERFGTTLLQGPLEKVEVELAQER